MGPATRSGCGALCIKANMPCRGCFGPQASVSDQGAKMLSAIASVHTAENEEDIAKMVEEIPDRPGRFYRFCMSTSILKAKRNGAKERAKSKKQTSSCTSKLK